MERLGVAIDPAKNYADAITRVRLAEELGLDSVWTTQLPTARDAAVVLAAYAGATSRIGLATGVLPLYTRHPTAMAQMALSLDELSGGRFRLGIGISHKVTVEGMWGLRLERPVEAMREYLSILRASVTEGSASIDGEHFTARWAYMAPRRAELPILISALNPRMLELAGELADGVVLWMCSAAYVRDHVIPHVRAGREKAGRTMEGFEVAAAIPISLTENPEEGYRAFRKTVERYAGLPFYRRMMDASGFAEELAGEEIPNHVLDELGGIGDRGQLRAIVQRYRDAGTTLPYVGPFGGHEGALGFEATLKAVAG